MRQQWRSFGRSLIGVAAVIGLFLTAAVSANAQWRNSDGYPNWGGSYQLRQTALNAGYNEGTEAGEDDRSRGRQRNLNDFEEYREATKDYNSRMGDRELYKRYFRLAFENGYNTVLGIRRGGVYTRDPYHNNRDPYYNNRDPYYSQGYRRERRGRNWGTYSNYGGSYEMRQTALNAGYNEGNEEGNKDRERNRRFDPYSNDEYRKASKDYNSRFGNLALYQRYFREGYINGYSDGYNYGYEQ